MIKPDWLIGIALTVAMISSAACSSAPSPPDQAPITGSVEAEEQCEPTPAFEVETIPGEYTEEARRAGVEGVVTALVEIDATGRVTSVRVVDGPGYGLDESAAEAIRQWRYEPATEDCMPVESQMRVRNEFVLSDDE